MRAVPFVEDANRLSDALNSAELDNDVQPAPRIAAVLEIEGVQVVVTEAKDRLLHDDGAAALAAWRQRHVCRRRRPDSTEPPRANPDR